jgi:glycine/D-amino acid oxidase-like deaminating enzyme
MDRRAFLTRAAAIASVAGVRTKIAFAKRPERVIVIGAGIMGTSIAYHLARRGAHVTVLEKARPAAGATQDSFAWLNSYQKNPHSYYELNLAGVMGWRRLALEMGSELPIQWGGSVQWAATEDEATKLKEQVVQRQRFGYPMRLIDPDEIAVLMPGVVTGPVKAAAFTDVEGALDPLKTTNFLLKQAIKFGASLICPCNVIALRGNAGVIETVVTSLGEMTADHYVLAAGVETMELARQAGIPVPLIEARGILAHSKPMSRILERVVVLPGGGGLGIKQNRDGRVVTGGHFGSNGNLDPTRELGAEMLSAAANYFPKLHAAQLEFMTLGYGVMPKDGLPVAGVDRSHPNTFIAAMNSGVTLAPIMGQLAAIELLDGVATDVLDPYRSSRFTDA